MLVPHLCSVVRLTPKKLVSPQLIKLCTSHTLTDLNQTHFWGWCLYYQFGVYFITSLLATVTEMFYFIYVLLSTFIVSVAAKLLLLVLLYVSYFGN